MVFVDKLNIKGYRYTIVDYCISHDTRSGRAAIDQIKINKLFLIVDFEFQ